MIRNKKILRVFALFMMVNILLSTVSPTLTWALTSGPQAPEFSSFEPVSTTDMVETFSGEFNYNLPVLNIPGPDGAGYAMSLSYHSGVSPEEESSWVGGWSLNPGSVNRNKRGYPDDYNGAEVIQYNKPRPTWTSGASIDFGLEYFSNSESAKEAQSNKQKTNDGIKGNDDLTAKASGSASLSYSKSARFNNYMGFSKFHGFGGSAFNGQLNVGMNVSAQGYTFSLSINPQLIYRKVLNKAKLKAFEALDDATAKQDCEAQDKAQKRLNILNAVHSGLRRTSFASAYTSTEMYGSVSLPVTVSSYRGVSISTRGSLAIYAPIPVGFEIGTTGSFSIITPKAKQEMKAYGYMHNPDYKAHLNDFDPDLDKLISTGDIKSLAMEDNILSDYSVEKGGDYNKRDKYLGIPFNEADNFMVNGEDISGGFRLFHDKIGQFYPNFVKSTQEVTNIGTEVGIGANLRIGLNFGGGKSYNIMTGFWGLTTLKNEDVTDHIDFDSRDKGFFRFNNDMGGEIDYTGNDKVTAAFIKKSNPLGKVPGIKSFTPNVGAMGIHKLDSTANKGKGRSSYIAYHTVDDFKKEVNNRFEKSTAVNTLSDYEGMPELNDGLKEFAITNEAGMRYVYGLPIYVRNEKSLTVNVDPKDTVDNKYLAYKKVFVGNNSIKDDNKVIIGTESNHPYAINHLLTQINTPDYVDVGNDGPDNKDFGGWTSFRYRKWKSEDNNEWYRFRSPYNGLLYDENQLSSKKDNTGSFSSGEKQKFYLKAIETKSHIAFFITNKTKEADFAEYTDNKSYSFLNGSGKPRYDGLGAAREVDELDPAAEKNIKEGKQRPEMLERIVLCSKNRMDRPMQTIYFEYDYSLCINLANNDILTSDEPGNILKVNNSGKLTLKKVWFEYEGVRKSRIAPYQFEYAYSHDYKDVVKSKYKPIAEFAMKLGDLAQKPDYKPFELDMWGNYQANGAERHANLQPWVYQGKQTPNDFDPAAWNLKRIILPSGGEIHIQYEQKDYSYVQDKKAMAMVSLLKDGIKDDYEPEKTEYHINLEDIGIEVGDIDAYVEMLKKYFVPIKGEVPPNYIYYKYLYSLSGDRQPDIDSTNCWSEHISGYTSVNEVGKAGNSIYFKLGNKSDWSKWYKLNKLNRNNIPRKVCYDYMTTHVDGMLEGNDCHCVASEMDEVEDKAYNLYNEMVKLNQYFAGIPKAQTIAWGAKVAIPAIRATRTQVLERIPKESNVCKYIAPQFSYLRLPVFKSKKGGGIRVKRLLMYDQGLESDNGDAALYGTEYIYENEDGTSSGVASNEPTEGREENALVELLDRKNQSWLNKMMAGEDKEQNEGPLGESLLPFPSVGHARVVIKNIHTGKTGTGFTVQEFYTVKEFPMKEVHTSLSGDRKKRDWMKIPTPKFRFDIDRYWLTQGYRFIIQNMHGVPKKTATYAGDYVVDKFEENAFLVSSTEYTYYDFEKESLKMLRYNPDTKAFSYYLGKPGKEEDIAMDMRSIHNLSIDLKFELDIGIMLSPAYAVDVSFAFQSFMLSDNAINTQVTSKVVRYPAVVKSVKSYLDNASTVTENLAFNPDTGKPVVTSTTDSYDGLKLASANGSTGRKRHNGVYYSWQIPASWIYNKMGQKVLNADNFNQLNSMVGSITTYGEGGNWLANKFDTTAIVKVWKTTDDQNLPQNVIEASAITLKDNWHANEQAAIEAEYGVKLDPKDFNQLNKVLRVGDTYTYKTGVASANKNSGRIYNGGVMTDFTLFPWKETETLPTISTWLKASETIKYSPHGNALEEKNILGIYSSARYGYNHFFPVMVANNAAYQSIFFEDFENNSKKNNVTYHSGRASLALTPENANYEFINSIGHGVVLDEHLINAGGKVKLWLKSVKDGDPTFENASPNFTLKINANIKVPFKKIAITGEWSLYEAKITNWGGLTKDIALKMQLGYNLASGEKVWIDDFRFQPFDAGATCYVYDVSTYKLLAQFDDQHFAVLFQYNNEGELVRKIVETERGTKTITETQYNTKIPAK